MLQRGAGAPIHPGLGQAPAKQHGTNTDTSSSTRGVFCGYSSLPVHPTYSLPHSISLICIHSEGPVASRLYSCFFFSHPLPVRKQLQNHRFLVLSSSPEISYSFSSPSDIHYFPESKSPYVERKWGVSGNSGGGRQAEGRGLGEWNRIEWCCALHKGLPASQSISRKSWYGLLELPCQSRNHGFGQTISQHKHREKRLFPIFL